MLKSENLELHQRKELSCMYIALDTLNGSEIWTIDEGNLFMHRGIVLLKNNINHLYSNLTNEQVLENITERKGLLKEIKKRIP